MKSRDRKITVRPLPDRRYRDRKNVAREVAAAVKRRAYSGGELVVNVLLDLGGKFGFGVTTGYELLRLGRSLRS